MLLSAYDEDIFYKQCTAIEKYVYPALSLPPGYALPSIFALYASGAET